MLGLDTTSEWIDEQAAETPEMGKQDRRRESLEANRPVRNSRPLGWMFFGAFLMPRSEHLIPFLN